MFVLVADVIASFTSSNSSREQELDEGLEVAERDDEPVSSGMVGYISYRREGTSCLQAISYTFQRNAL
jgi:hypothetical protein